MKRSDFLRSNEDKRLWRGIKVARKIAGLTQVAMAQKIGMSKYTYGEAEHLEVPIATHHLVRTCEVLLEMSKSDDILKDICDVYQFREYVSKHTPDPQSHKTM